MIEFKNTYLRKIPSVGKIIDQLNLSELENSYSHSIAVQVIRQIIEDRKNSILKAQTEDQIRDIDLSIESIILEAKDRIKEMDIVGTKYAINATGDVLNIELGSPINEFARKALFNISKGYSITYGDISQILSEITSAESGIVVNNNTAGIFLVLNTICKGKELIVSRGELVETEKSRLIDIIEKSGAKLNSVGTTNKTHLYDYQKAINDNTGAIIKVNKSNFYIIGFVEQVPLADLVSLAKESGILLIEIMENGCLLDLTQLGLSEEPYVPLSVKIGSDIVCFSSGRLMGGPESGIIVGRSDYISMIKENPLYQAFKPSKFIVSLLSATLKSYFDDPLKHNITIQFLGRSVDEIRNLNRSLIEKLKVKKFDTITLSLVDGHSKIKSFSIRSERFPTEFIVIRSNRLTPKELSEKLINRKIPIIVNVNGESISLDLRSIFTDELDEIAKALMECFD
ncbi:MAG: L-seryl-tRNA(Sec) selenium transferase [Candidatus Poribacteria bacterium]